MPPETQWRACAKDHNQLAPDYGEWTNDEALARTTLDHSLLQADPPYDETWLERRTVSEPERVE